MATIPPVPPLPANPTWDQQFAYWSALQRSADMQAQTDAILAQVAQAKLATEAMVRANALFAADVAQTDADRVWALIEAMVKMDTTGLVRTGLGMGNVTEWADQAMKAFRMKYPVPPAA